MPSRTAEHTIVNKPSTLKEKAKITAGAAASLIMVGWMVLVAVAILFTL
jgi:hypothetical protein